MTFNSLAYAAMLFIASMASVQAEVQPSQGGAVSTFVVPKGPPPPIDYRNAAPIPMPQAHAAPNNPSSDQGAGNSGPPQVVPGATGDGKQNPAKVPPPARHSQVEAIPQEYGTASLPFTTARAAALNDATQNYYPFRATGKLFFSIDGSSYVCTASLVGPGLVVTAAHCVAKFGKNRYYAGWTFIPAYNNGAAPFGIWYAAAASVLTSYLNGTDPCAQRGVVCRDDVAILTIAAQSGRRVGDSTGWYGYGINGYSFAGNQVAITQLGYPVDLDDGGMMERNDAQGTVNAADSHNTEIGSLMTGGSSGGPWLVNFGVAPALNGTSQGKSATYDVVVGVTSFGSTSDQVKRQGASSFTTSNIKNLVDGACSATPAAC